MTHIFLISLAVSIGAIFSVGVVFVAFVLWATKDMP